MEENLKKQQEKMKRLELESKTEFKQFKEANTVRN